jgi:kynureninase
MTEEFVPIDSADAWQLSNPPVLALVPLKVSLGIFDEAGMEALRQRSEMLTGALDERIREIAARTGGFEIITPRDPAARGCQLSIRVRGDAQALHRRLQDAGVICDFRRPDVIRVAPTPLYNTMEDVEAFASVLAASAG